MDEDADKNNQDSEEGQVLDEDLHDGLLDGHIVDESLVDMIEELLRLKGVIFLDPPQILGRVKVSIVALLLHLRGGEVRDRLEVVLGEDSLDLWLRAVIDNAEESWHFQAVLCFTVGVGGSCQLCVDQLTLITP